MAKELPYFKFEPAEYIAGDIQDCSFEAQGVFINICALYWIKQGALFYASALQRICKGNESALQELINVDVISIEQDQIVIDFLDNQLNEFVETSEKRRKAANKRWSNTKAMQVHSKSNAIREDKIREDKIREDERLLIFDDFWDRYDKKVSRDQALKAFKKLKQKDIEEIHNVLDDYVRAKPDKKFRPNFSTFLRQRRWKDEIINEQQNGNTKEAGNRLIQQLAQTDAWQDA